MPCMNCRSYFILFIWLFFPFLHFPYLYYSCHALSSLLISSHFLCSHNKQITFCIFSWRRILLAIMCTTIPRAITLTSPVTRTVHASWLRTSVKSFVIVVLIVSIIHLVFRQTSLNETSIKLFHCLGLSQECKLDFFIVILTIIMAPELNSIMQVRPNQCQIRFF